MVLIVVVIRRMRSGRRKMNPRKPYPYFILILIVVFSLFSSPLLFADTAFTDGFEAIGAAWDDKWDGNDATTWVQGTTGSGGYNPHSGTYDAWCDPTHDGYLTSDNIDLSSASVATLSIWILKDDIEPNDFLLYYFDGTDYILIVDLDTLGNDDTWINYNVEISSNYFISNFRIRFSAVPGSSENVYVDDVLVSYTPSVNSDPTNDACDSSVSFDVGIDGYVHLTITDTNLIADLNYAEIQVTTSDSKVFTLRWTQVTDIFSEVSDVDNICTLSASSGSVNVDADTVRAQFVFAISVGAQKGACNVQAYSLDDSAGSDTDTYTSEFSVNFYIEITVGDSAHGWTGIVPGTTDELINAGGGSDGDIDVTVSSNGAFSLQTRGDGDLTYNGATIPVGNVKVHADTLGSATSLSTSYANIGGLTNQAKGSSLAKAFKLWITVPSPKEDGGYTYTLYVRGVEYV